MLWLARFRFPRNQYDRMYNGCHPIWGYEYREIREWMAPWWLMLIQFISAPAFLLMNIALVIDVALYLRIPMEHVLRSVEVVCRCDSISGPVSFPFHSGRRLYLLSCPCFVLFYRFHIFRFEYNLVLINFVMKTVVTVMIFFCVAMFGGMCWDREWLLYPNYNYPSWSYGVAVFAMIINGVAAFFMWMEAVEAKERKERNQNLLMMMYPSAGFGTGTMSSYHGSQFI